MLPYHSMINLKEFGAYLLCSLFSAGVGDQQSYWLCHQRVLQHECVGDDLGQSRLSGVQLLTTVCFLSHRLHSGLTPNMSERTLSSILKGALREILHFESVI